MRWWIALAGLYLVLAWSVQAAELVLAALAATIGTAGAALVRAPLRLPARGIARPLLGLFGDLVPLVRALAARRGGRIERVPVQGSRAQTEALGSLAPASIVVRIEGDEALVHRL
jgi:hypothetical protein